jgi:hypothetical protein
MCSVYDHNDTEGDMDDPTRDVPADLAAVQADDELLDRVARNDGNLSLSDLERLLVVWRRSIEVEPQPELVDVDTARAAIRAGSQGGRRRFRQWMRNLIRWRWKS